MNFHYVPSHIIIRKTASNHLVAYQIEYGSKYSFFISFLSTLNCKRKFFPLIFGTY